MRSAKWVWRLPECSIIVMRLCSSEQLKMQSSVSSEIHPRSLSLSLPTKSHWSSTLTTSVLLLLSSALREKLKVVVMPNTMINLLLAVKALEGKNEWSTPSPLLLSVSLSHTAGFICPLRTNQRTKLAGCSVQLSGYVNVSGLVGGSLSGWAEEVNKRVWMRGRGQRVERDELIDYWPLGQPMWMQIFIQVIWIPSLHPAHFI